jgi:adenylate kinase
VTERLRVYEEQTRPLIEFYRARGLLRVIDAQGKVEEVTQRLEQALHASARPRAARTGAASSRKTGSPGRSTPRGKGASRRTTGSASGSKRKASARTTRAPDKSEPARRAPGKTRSGSRRSARRARR